MTRTRISVFAAFVAVAALVAAGVSFAQTPPAAPRGPALARQGGAPPFGSMGMFRGLDLTQAQRDQLRALAEARRQQDDPVMQRVRELNRALQNELFADAPDEGKIEQLKIDLNLAQQQALDARIAGQLKVAQILTPEQRQQVREAREQGLGGPRGRRGPRGMGVRPGGAGL